MQKSGGQLLHWHTLTVALTVLELELTVLALVLVVLTGTCTYGTDIDSTDCTFT